MVVDASEARDSPSDADSLDSAAATDATSRLPPRPTHDQPAPPPSTPPPRILNPSWHEKALTEHPYAMFCNMIIACFERVQLPQKMARASVVRIPKPDSAEMRGIGIVESPWKVISAIINNRIMERTKFHDTIHGFRPGRGTGSAILEVKLAMSLAALERKTLFIVYLDLKKAYDSISRERLLTLLRSHGVGGRLIALLRNYWLANQVAVKQQGCYGPAFSTGRGVTQGDILSPGIFNLVMDTVARNLEHWAKGTDGDEYGSNLFYADDGFLSSTSPTVAAGLITESQRLFGMFGLKLNPQKTKVMVNHLTGSTPMESEEKYRERCVRKEKKKKTLDNHEGPLLRSRSMCVLCRTTVPTKELSQHMGLVHGIQDRLKRTEVVDETTRVQGVEEVTIQVASDTTVCPAPRCTYTPSNTRDLRRHIGWRHPFANIVLARAPWKLFRCQTCGIIRSSPEDQQHLQALECRELTARNERLAAWWFNREMEKWKCEIDGTEVENVQEFKYLGRMIVSNNSDKAAINFNLTKARKKWARFRVVLEKESASPRTRSLFYKAVVQAVLLYGAGSWTISDANRRKLASFHHGIARQLTGRRICHIPGTEIWVYPETDEVLKEAGLFTMDEYIRRRKATLSYYDKNCSENFAKCSRVPVNNIRNRKECWWL